MNTEMTEEQQAELETLVQQMLERRKRADAREAQGLPRVKGPRMADPVPEVQAFVLENPDATATNRLLLEAVQDERLWRVVHVALACFRCAPLEQAVVALGRIHHRDHKALLNQFVLAATRDVLAGMERRLAAM